MTGAGGIGSGPSSRLTRLLQEKAEAIRKRRKSAEDELGRLEERIRLLGEIEIPTPSAPTALAQIEEARKKGEWESVESLSKAEFEQLDKGILPAVDAQRTDLIGRLDQLRKLGVPIPTRTDELAASVRSMSLGSDLPGEIQGLARLKAAAAEAQSTFLDSLRNAGRALGRWLELPKSRLDQIESTFSSSLTVTPTSTLAQLFEGFQALVTRAIPEAVERRDAARALAESAIALGKEVGLPLRALDEALASDGNTLAVGWVESVGALESATAEAVPDLRSRTRETIEALRTILESLREQGSDPTQSLADLDQVVGRVDSVPVPGLSELIAESRRIADEPVVEVVATLLDEVRPKLVELKQLERDSSEILGAMNRAREALRLKIFGEALAAAQEAIDRAYKMTADLEQVREEAEALGQLLDRLQRLKVPVAPFQEKLALGRRQLDLFKVDPARAAIRDAVKSLGRDGTRYLSGELRRLEGSAAEAAERGFAPPTAGEQLADARRQLEAGALAETAEALAKLDVELRGSAAPYIARRIEEIEKAFAEISKPDLGKATRRLLADADVFLRVRDDLGQSLDALKRAEHEFSLAFAAEASSLVESLEEHQRTLQEMGGAPVEFERQLDEVRQIFDMGDFVKASQAARELVTRAREKELAKGEASIAEAKLALVELSGLGIEVPEFKTQLDKARAALKAGEIFQAHRAASEIATSAAAIRESAQAVSRKLEAADARITELSAQSVELAPVRVLRAKAASALHAREFEKAEELLVATGRAIDAALEAWEVDQATITAQGLIDEGRRLGLPIESDAEGLAEAQARIGSGRTSEGLQGLVEIGANLLETLRPIYEENLKALDHDFDQARFAGLEIGGLAGLLASARRRLEEPVPIGAAEMIEQARRTLSESQAFLHHAELVLKRVREAYGEAELLRAATPTERTRLMAIERALADRQYGRVLEVAGPLEQELRRASQQTVARTLAGVQGLLVRVHKEGVVTASAEELLQQGRAALENGEPLKALRFAGQSEREIERIDLQVRLARGAVETLEGRIAQSHSEGLRTGRADELLRAATAHLHESNAPTAIEEVLEGMEALSEIRDLRRRADDEIATAQLQLSEAVEAGLAPGETGPGLEEARRRLEQGDYGAAAAAAREAREQARSSVDRLFAAQIAEIRAVLEAMRSAKLPEAPSTAEHLKEAEGLLQSKSWAGARAAIERARERATPLLESAVADRIRTVGKLREEAGLAQGGQGDWERRLAEANERKAFGQILVLLGEGEREALAELRRQAEARLADFKGSLWVGERLGADTSPAMAHYVEARAAYEKGDGAAVAPACAKGAQLLDQIVRTRLDPILKEVDADLTFSRDGLRASTGNLEERLGEVRRLLGEGHSIDAGRGLLEVAEELESRKALHHELRNLHYLIEAAIYRAGSRRIDVTEARQLLDESLRGSIEDYPAAIEKAREALRKLEGVLNASAPATEFWPFKGPPASNEPST